MSKTEFLEFQGNQIEVERVESGDFDYILYKATNSNDFYLVIVSNRSFIYHDKTVKVEADHIQEYLDGKLPSKQLVNKYR